MLTTLHRLGRATLLAGVVAGGVGCCATASGADTATVAPAPVSSGNWHAREGVYFQRTWGVDIVGVKRVSSGYMLEFSYRVLDAAKAKGLSDKTARPYLVDEASGARLAVPAMENIGELRQTATPTVDRIYYIIFGNPGRLVKPGSRVSVLIGKFRVDGLVVK
jgi:hypothetical protein